MKRTQRTCGALLALALASNPLALPAQTLARRNWEGSGMSAQSWWRGAVFYRIQPANFQDSTGSGTGDLKGIAERMGYLHSLGVDALVLEPPFDRNDTNGFDALLSAASQNRIRVIVGIGHDSGVNPVAEGRAWLSRGAAGLEVEATGAGANPALVNDTLAALRSAARAYPGERVLLAHVDAAVAAQLHSPRGAAADLVAVDIDSVARKDNSPASLASSLRQSLAIAQAITPPPAPMLFSDDTTRSASVFAPAHASGGKEATPGPNATIAAMLLASQPAAVSLLYGQELGLESTDANVRMQWTPSNITPATWKPEEPHPAEPAEEATHAAAPPPKPAYDPNVYGAYHAYVPPPPRPKGPAPFDPNALRGFTSKGAASGGSSAKGSAASGSSAAESTGSADRFSAAGLDATRSVALEERDESSLLRLYEKLIALRHDNPVLRGGALKIFNHDAENVLVWMRLPPPGTTTAQAVVVVCNLADAPVTLSIADDLKQLHRKPVALRRLASAPDGLFETSSHIVLPAHGVYIGELYKY